MMRTACVALAVAFLLVAALVLFVAVTGSSPYPGVAHYRLAAFCLLIALVSAVLAWRCKR